MALGLRLYLFASQFTESFADRKLKERLAVSKEDPERIDERRGLASVPRPPGHLVWFHAASVGESLSLIELIEIVLDEHPDTNVLVTTGTKSSAEVIEQRLPGSIIHQFAPLDTKAFVNRFLEHWAPDIAVWTESELWPALIWQTHRTGCRMIMLNARMSEKSFKRWRILKGTAAAMLGCFHTILAQDEITAGHLTALGVAADRMTVTGSLKESAGPLPFVEADRSELAGQIDTRPVWLAASTHPGEEEIVAAAHLHIRRRVPRALLIVAPRHPERSADIASMLREDEIQVSVRSEGDPITARTEIYLADTLGEMGLWYRLAPISFLGGSLVPIGGHNPYEPAALGSAILHGPHVANAGDVYQRLTEVGAAKEVTDAKDLADAVISLQAPHLVAEMARAGWELSSTGAQAIETAKEVLDEALNQLGGF